MRYVTLTLGCKVNQFETEAMETLLKERGHIQAIEGETADIVIVNTCAVTAESGRKSRQAIRRLMGEHPGAVTAVCGCFSQLSPEDVKALGADVVFGSAGHAAFIDAIEKTASDRALRTTQIDDPFKRRIFEPLPAGAVAGRTRALLKIQDGCDNFCSYCVIPYTRGRVRSLPPEKAAAEAIRLEQEGYKEIIITGIEISSYGKDLEGKPSLADVVMAVTDAVKDVRIRLGSIEPTVITREFCEKLAKSKKLCRHFHLSLQSGCDNTLRRMRRKYDTERFYQCTELLREYFPGCGLTADLITGFPGETIEEHEETLRFIRKCGFSSMHVFPYSQRPGTKAAEMDGQLSRAEKARRAKEAQTVADAMEDEFLNGSVGHVLPVLFETYRDGMSAGHTDTYCLTQVNGLRERGVVENVQIIGVKDKMLVAKDI